MQPYHELKYHLSNGLAVYHNRIQGYSIEADFQFLRAPDKREALEIAQLVADDDAAWAEECEREKAASVANTDLW